MLRLILAATLSLLTGGSVLAEISAVVVQNGSLIRCEEKADLGRRAFRLHVISASETTVTLNLETLVCMSLGDTQKLQAMPISTPYAQLFDGGVYTFEIIQPEMVVTNSEITREIQRVPFDGRLSSQHLIVDRASISEKSIDLTIMGLGLTKKNDIIEHQGMTTGGHFRIDNLN